MSRSPVVNREDVTEREVAEGDIAFARRRLGAAAGARRIGCSWFAVPPGARQMPVHVHGDEEEIFFVVSGSGVSWRRDEACTVSPGDVVVHRPAGQPHTFLAGEEGLELLAFGSGSETSLTFLPRAGVMWAGPRWVPLDAPHPFRAEGLAGPLQRPEIDPAQPRPDSVVALVDVEIAPGFPSGSRVRPLGHAAGAVKAGLNHATLAPGIRGAPPHCHALEEELFVILDGAGTVTLGAEDHPLRAGDVIARPASTGIAHHLIAGDQPMTYLAYGTRDAGDSVYYPEIGKVRVRGLGVTLDVATA